MIDRIKREYAIIILLIEEMSETCQILLAILLCSESNVSPVHSKKLLVLGSSYEDDTQPLSIKLLPNSVCPPLIYDGSIMPCLYPCPARMSHGRAPRVTRWWRLWTGRGGFGRVPAFYDDHLEVLGIWRR